MPSDPRRPRRAATTVLAPSVLALVTLVGCGGDDPSDQPVAGQTSTAEPGSAEPTPSPVESAFPSRESGPTPLPDIDETGGGAFAAGRLDVRLVDTSRGTAGGVGSEPKEDRTLPVRVLYPARGTPGAEAEEDLPAADGRFPLFVFAHGLGGNGPAYEELVRPLAEAGYVVALPTFPLSSGRNPSYLDVVNQPTDVSFVLDELLEEPEVASSVDGEQVAVGGHSLGAATSWGITYVEGLVDDRVDAMVSFAGARLDLGEGGYAMERAVPTLVVHGRQDATLPFSGSAEAFGDLAGPAYFLRLRGAGHTDLFAGREAAVVVEATRAFLDAWLRDRPAALARVGDRVEEAGVGTWATRNTD